MKKCTPQWSKEKINWECEKCKITMKSITQVKQCETLENPFKSIFG
jgi:hypothetical protein